MTEEEKRQLIFWSQLALRVTVSIGIEVKLEQAREKVRQARTVEEYNQASRELLAFELSQALDHRAPFFDPWRHRWDRFYDAEDNS